MKLNRTLKYLKPYIEILSKPLQEVHDKLQKVGYYIGDVIYDQEITNKLFIICRVNEDFEILLEKMSKTKEYLDDYVYDEHHHIIVVGFPNSTAFNAFSEGKYSEMYTKSELNNITEISQIFDLGYGMKVRHSTWRVLTKDQSYRRIFQHKLYEEFGTSIIINDDRELDLPINEEEEVLFN